MPFAGACDASLPPSPVHAWTIISIFPLPFFRARRVVSPHCLGPGSGLQVQRKELIANAKKNKELRHDVTCLADWQVFLVLPNPGVPPLVL